MSKKVTTETFLSDSVKVHGYKYDYALVEYEMAKKSITIICKKHGEFKQLPTNHLKGHGCPRCAAEDRAKNSALKRKDKFISRAIKIHGDKYDYSHVEYNNYKTRIKIICKIHGEFEQTPIVHLQGGNCPKCIGRFYYTKDGLVSYESKFKKDLESIGVECFRNKDDKYLLNVGCHFCKKVFTPTIKDVIRKIEASKNNVRGESNLYCSDKCKDACPTFNFKPHSIDPRSNMYINTVEKNVVRNCQTNHLKQLQCDEIGHNYCEKCGDIIDVELHHTLEVSKFGKDAINSSSHILLCAGCHSNLHETCNKQ